MKDLEAIIRRHLPVARFDDSAGGSTAYHESFRVSGQAKGANVLNILNDLHVDLQSCAYVSIGGSYGSEIVWLMDNSDLKRGVLLEYESSVIPEVTRESKRLEKEEKELALIIGDATQKADSCRDVVKKWQHQGTLETVVCSAQAVFHELPTRSPNFHRGNFLDKLLSGWPRAVFISREPCDPSGWPERVELCVPNLPAKTLEELALEIQRRLTFDGKVHRVGAYVELSAALAVETLVKIFYANDMQHELQERLTTIVPDDFVADLEKLLGPYTASYRLMNSKGFEENYRKLRVSAQDVDRRPLTIPLTFCEIIADSHRSTAAHGLSSSPIVTPARNEHMRGPQPAASANGSEPAPAEPTSKTVRYLRRRCRVITRGTKQFRTIMYSLLSRKYDSEERIKRFEASWETLRNPYEQLMTHATFLESIGNIELMRTVLGRSSFRGPAESARMLYEAVACEKLDDINSAQRLLRIILDTEKQKDLLRAAQFNMHVCYEKSRKFENVNFEAFLEDENIAFVDGERLSDKAVAMQMIVCMEQDRPFLYRQLLNKSLEFLSKNSRAGYAKTLLTKIEYDKTPLTSAAIGAIVDHLKLMEVNSRTAILVRLCDYLPSDAEELRKSLVEMVGRESDKFQTVAKWKQARRQL